MSKELISKKIADKAGISQAAAERAFDAFISSVVEEAKAGNDVTIVGFGTFKLAHRAAGVTPAGLGEKLGGKAYPAYTHLRFDDSKLVRDQLTKAQPAPETQEDGA